jgi:hypothetical protein
MDPVIGGPRDVTGAVSAAAKPVYSTVLDLPSQRVGDCFRGPALNGKTMVAEAFNQFGHGRWALIRQMESEHVAQFDTAEIHCRNVACRYDITAIVAVRRAHRTPPGRVTGVTR